MIPCGVNVNLFRPIDQEKARRRLNLNGEDVLLFVGRIVPIKGLDHLLMALPYLEAKRPVKLLVIGGDDRSSAFRGELRNLTRELGINDHVTFLGFVNHEELPLFYSAADVCVIPSYHESFGLVALESLACGTPVIATKVGVMESVIRSGHTGYVVDNNTPVLLACKIVRFLSEVSRTPKPIDVIRASVLPFTWSHIAEAVEREYASVLKKYVTKS